MRYGATCLGGMLELRIVKCGEKTEISHPRIIPIVCHYGADHRGHRVYTLNMYTDALAASHGTQSEGNEMPFCKETLTRIYNNNIDKEFR